MLLVSRPAYACQGMVAVVAVDVAARGFRSFMKHLAGT